MVNTIIIERLKEREKELKSLYRLNELLEDPTLKPDELFKRLIVFLPLAYRYTSVSEARVSFEGEHWQTEYFKESPWMDSSEIVVDKQSCGSITVCYTHLIDEHHTNQFLPEEHLFLRTITDRVGKYFFQQRLENSIALLREEERPSTENHPMGGNDKEGGSILGQQEDYHWKWRERMAIRISECMPVEQLGVKAIYLVGSVKNGTAGPASDIDLLIHHRSDPEQLHCLQSWLDGWSCCLTEINFEYTGLHVSGLIDLHMIADDDIHYKARLAGMIGAKGEAARLLRRITY